MNGQLHAPAALSPRKERRYQLDRRLDEPQSLSERGEEKIPSLPPGIKSPKPRSSSL